MGLNTGTSTHLHTQDIPDKVNYSKHRCPAYPTSTGYISQLTAQ